MGGNRVNKLRLLLNIFTVWFLTGFWHGAEWNFIIWGIYFALFLLLEKYFLAKHLEKLKVINHIYVLFFTAISFAIFSANGIKEALSVVGGMFGAGSIPFISGSFLYSIKNYGVIILISALASTPLFTNGLNYLSAQKKTGSLVKVLEIPILVTLMIVITAYLADGSFNPFLYFRF